MAPEKAERVIAAVNWLLANRFDENKAALGRKLGLSGSAVSQWSTKNTPSAETAEKIAELCGTNYGDLVAGRWSPDGVVVERDNEFPNPIPELIAEKAVTERAARLFLVDQPAQKNALMDVDRESLVLAIRQYEQAGIVARRLLETRDADDEEQDLAQRRAKSAKKRSVK